MPKKISRKIGEVHQVTTVPTFVDKVKEFLGTVAGAAVIFGILFLLAA